MRHTWQPFFLRAARSLPGPDLSFHAVCGAVLPHSCSSKGKCGLCFDAGVGSKAREGDLPGRAAGHARRHRRVLRDDRAGRGGDPGGSALDGHLPEPAAFQVSAAAC